MNINKDSLVTSVCGMKSCITLEKLLTLLKKHFFGIDDDDLEYIIDELNNLEPHEWWQDGQNNQYGMWFEGSGLGFEIAHVNSIEQAPDLLNDIFGEEYYVMYSSGFRFSFGNDSDKIPCSKNIIYVCGDEFSFSEVLKNINETEVLNTKKENFLTDEERKKLDTNYDDINSGFIEDNNCFYYIKKTNFNKDKWWLNWESKFEY